MEPKTPPTEKESILVVDDASGTLEVIRRNLISQGYKIITALSVAEAVDILNKKAIDLVITDYKMPVADGFDLLRHVRENFRSIEVVMITGFPSLEGAVRAVKGGAEEYLAKPFTDEELFGVVGRALEKHRKRKKTSVIQIPADRFGLIGESRAIQQVLHAIQKSAQTSATVLICGESGTGKEIVARAIHYNSPRASAPFVPINCGGIPENLLESELFGYIKGAFTGASESRAGFFQTADRGTIFLDEISEASLSMQVKLLRVLQDREILMLGSKRPTTVDVRIMAATNKDLAALVHKGLFREDLFYRLNVVMISLPTLRERGDDIYLLIRHFARKFSREFGRSEPRISEEAMGVLTGYHWPGNVREVENVLQRLVVMSERDVIEISDLPPLMRFTALAGSDSNRPLAEVEDDHIRRVMDMAEGNKSRAAKILGIDRKTLREKLKKAMSETS